MKLYELTYLVAPEVSEEELRLLQEKIASLIQKEEGFLNESSPPIQKDLAFPIKKKQKAFLVSLLFQLNPNKLEVLEKKLKEEEKIIRYLILSKKLPKKIPTPSPMEKKKIIKPKTKAELEQIEKKLEEILSQ